MPAPDLATILSFEDAIEPAVKTLLQAQAVAQVALQRGTGKLVSGRVDVELTMGAATGHLYTPANLPDGPVDSRYDFEDAWNATVALMVVTDRDTNGNLHSIYRAAVRQVMLQYFTQFTTAVLPYHEIAMCKSTGCRGGLKTDKDEDFSQLNYSLVIGVRAGAWPAPF